MSNGQYDGQGSKEGWNKQVEAYLDRHKSLYNERFSNFPVFVMNPSRYSPEGEALEADGYCVELSPVCPESEIWYIESKDSPFLLFNLKE